MNRYLTVADVADEVGVSMRTVLRWVERGDVPAMRLPGGQLRVPRSEFEEAVASWTVVPTGSSIAAVNEDAA